METELVNYRGRHRDGIQREAECWTGGGMIYLRWVDGSKYDFPIDINDDGTIDTPEGESKKKGS